MNQKLELWEIAVMGHHDHEPQEPLECDCNGPGVTHFLNGCKCQMRYHDWLVRVESRARRLSEELDKDPVAMNLKQLEARDELKRVLWGENK